MIFANESFNEDTVRYRLRCILETGYRTINTLLVDGLDGNFKFDMSPTQYPYSYEQALKQLRFILFYALHIDSDIIYTNALLQEIKQLKCFEDLVKLACNKLDLEGRFIHDSRPDFLERRLEL